MDNSFVQMHFGEILALITAIIWAISVIFFKKSGETINPLSLNLFKNSVAFILIIPTMILFSREIFRDVPLSEYLLLFTSGIIGIGVADSLFFRSLNLVGASRSAIIDCMYSPSIIILSMVWIGETMTVIQIIGAILIISAVLTVSQERKSLEISKHDLVWGVVWGASAMVLTAIGIVMIKPLLDHSPVMWAMEVRLIGAILFLNITILYRKDRSRLFRQMIEIKDWKYMFPGAFFGSYVALVLWLGGMKYTQASTASAINQSATIFIFIFAAIFLKEKITRMRVLGIILGVIGLILVTFKF